MDVKPYTLKELFKNEAFRRFAPFFLEDFRTILEVEEQSKISRQTISAIIDRSFKQENRKYKYVEWSYSKKGKPLRIKVELISDYLSEVLGLTEDEVRVVNELIKQDLIHKTITKGNIFLDIALMKTFNFIMIAAIRNQIEIEDPKYYERIKYFNTAFQTAYKKAPRSLMQDINKLLPKGGIPLPFGLDNVKNEAVEPWLKEYTKTNRKQLERILVKMRLSTFPIITSLSNLYDNLIARSISVLHIKRSLEIGNQDWIKQQMKFMTALKAKKRRKQESDAK